jgi:predicted nucleic acid-binding protein
MPKNILIDLNIILDVFLERKGFEASSDVIQLSESKNYNLYISAHIVSTLAYLLGNAKVPRSQVIKHIDWMLQVFAVIPVDGPLLSLALKSNVRDFEDAIIEQAARASSSSLIITRNLKDFKASTVEAMAPEQFLQSLGKL